MTRPWFLVAFTFLLSTVASKPFFPSFISALNKTCRQPVVEITVSPVITKESLRILDIEWDVEEEWEDGDWVGLYRQEPSANLVPVFSANATEPEGWVRTGVQEGRNFSDTPNWRKTCLGWWTAYWRRGSSTPVVTSCLSSNPTWMEDEKEYIKKISLTELFVPGTHDAASFRLAYSPYKESLYEKYVFTQDETILEQLISGARYLDLRIGKYKNGWWLNHGVVRVRPLEYVLEDIKLFINSTKEIVILDLHNFPVGFKPEVHDEFVQYLVDHLGDIMASPSEGWTSTIGSLLNSNQRLIVAYNDQRTVAKHTDKLWWPVSQKWANARTYDALLKYFNDIFDNPRSLFGRPWSAMVELTPSAWDVLSDKNKGLRRMADSTNHNISSWFRGDWGKKANIVAADFIRSTGIVNAAIRWNRRKGTNSNCDP